MHSWPPACRTPVSSTAIPAGRRQKTTCLAARFPLCRCPQPWTLHPPHSLGWRPAPLGAIPSTPDPGVYPAMRTPTPQSSGLTGAPPAGWCRRGSRTRRATSCPRSATPPGPRGQCRSGLQGQAGQGSLSGGCLPSHLSLVRQPCASLNHGAQPQSCTPAPVAHPLPRPKPPGPRARHNCMSTRSHWRFL